MDHKIKWRVEEKISPIDAETGLFAIIANCHCGYYLSSFSFCGDTNGRDMEISIGDLMFSIQAGVNIERRFQSHLRDCLKSCE